VSTIISPMKNTVSPTIFLGLVSTLASLCYPCCADGNSTSDALSNSDYVSASPSITLTPAVRPLSIASHNISTTMLFQVESADDPSVMCIMSEGSRDKVCGGYFMLDLQPRSDKANSDVVEVLFTAPSGFEIEMNALDGLITFEFEAHNTNSRDLNCDRTNPVSGSSPNMLSDLSITKHQIAPRLFDPASTADLRPTDISPEISPQLVGSKDVEKLTLDSELSFARVSICEIFFKLKFQGLSSSDTVRFSQMTFSMPYDSSSILLKEAQEYHYQSSTPMGIKALNPRLVELEVKNATSTENGRTAVPSNQGNGASSIQDDAGGNVIPTSSEINSIGTTMESGGTDSSQADGDVAVYVTLTNENTNTSSIRGFVSQAKQSQDTIADSSSSCAPSIYTMITTALVVAISLLCSVFQ
jgi:hypothetical protein